MNRIARFLAHFFAALALGSAAAADPFQVRDLNVDVTAASPQAAQQQGWAQARLEAARRLIDRLTLPADRAAASQPVDPAAVARLYTSVDFQGSEKRTATRYIAVLIVNFDGKAVRDYLDQRNVPFVETQAGKALISPTVAGALDPVAWAGLWKETNDETILTPYVVSVEAWDRRPAWDDVAAEAQSRGAGRAVVAEAYQQGGQIYVRLSDLRSGSIETTLGIAGPFGTLESAQAGAVTAMENAWKVASIVRTTGSTSMALVAVFRDIAQWVKIRKGLESSRMISGLMIESISTTGADLSFVYAGRPDQLAADLRARGLELGGTDRGWTLAAQ
ncbi:MAG: DUF2066 domain-containing protein [Alphaproteobacteria bacterium]|nr:DUF2066 domain-containing protein [Alphaproteobacteria bacterium]